MKKINDKGFTLIELLAVITILGILMMVAIPAVSKTIENSRRDTFADITLEYLKTVRNAVLADNIECAQNVDEHDNYSNYTPASGTPDGTYFYVIDSTKESTTDLMESGGKSSFGNANVKGYVVWKKETTPPVTDAAGVVTKEARTRTKYYAILTDTGKHGLSKLRPEEEIKRANVTTKLNETVTNTTDDKIDLTDDQANGLLETKPYHCKLS